MRIRSQGVQHGIYRALLLLYPRSFRREYGGLMAQVFSDRVRERGGLRTWFVVVVDLSLSVPQQILEVSLMSQKWMGAIASLASVALVTAFAVGAGPPIVLAGAAAAVGLLAFVSAKRRGLPTEYLYGGTAPKTWTWWTVLAALLAGTYVLAAVGQLIDDPKATNVGALGIMIGFAGLIAVGLRFRSRSRIAGNWIVVFATVPALMFFWVVVPTLVALAIIIGAVTEVSRATPRGPLAA